MSDFVLVERPPTVDEFLMLRNAVRWRKVGREAAEISVGNALYSICLEHDGRIIGCGRVVGDGGIYFFIQDMIVLPEYQGKGLGKRIMDAIMEYISKRARPGAKIGLMAARGYSGFYKKYGFTERPQDAPGMQLFWRKDEVE